VNTFFYQHTAVNLSAAQLMSEIFRTGGCTILAYSELQGKSKQSIQSYAT